MRKMPRLRAVAGCVPLGSVVTDIGTDHAYLPVYLVLEGVSPKVIAVERSEKNSVAARLTLERFGLGRKVELRVGDGLSVIDRSDGVHTVVLAGLGGRTICDILNRGREKLKWFNCFVLQPQGDVYALRRWLTANLFCITHERLVREDRRFYEIIVARHGKQRVNDPLLQEVGSCLMQRPDPLLVPYLEDKINRCRRISAALGSSSRHIQRKEYFLEKEARLKEVLSTVAPGANSD